MSESPASSARGVFVGETVDNVPLCVDHYRLRVRLPGFPPSRPGQFVQVQCRPPEPQAPPREVDWPADRPPRLTQPELTAREPLLRRPLSLAGRRDLDDGATELTLIYRAVGIGTHWLAGVEAGQSLSVLGPLGNGFAIRPDKPAAVCVGGGVGIPPMIYLAGSLAAAGRRATAFCGARSRDVLSLTFVDGAEVRSDAKATPCAAEFARAGVPAVLATDDGSLGFEGFVSNALRKWLDETTPWPDDVVVYCCGPEPLMKAVADLCLADGIECQLALERHMACGMGTCQSCVVKIRDESERGWSFRLCCTDGPVFDAREVLW